MSTLALTLQRLHTLRFVRPVELAPHLVAGLAFLVLFWTPLATLVRDWIEQPDAGHGLLLAPLAVFFAVRAGVHPKSRPQPLLGVALLLVAILARYVGGLAAELFSMRAGLLAAILGLIVYHRGVRQLVHWWLPISLFVLSIPLPNMILGTISLPLQLKASQIGAALLSARDIPVLLKGNVIYLPGQTLFVTEACSGLRSLAALLALGVLIGGMWLRSPASRVLLVLSALPVAMVLNGVRVFLTGFLVVFVDPSLGQGFMHMTEGWLIFVVAFAILGGISWTFAYVEDRFRRTPTPEMP